MRRRVPANPDVGDTLDTEGVSVGIYVNVHHDALRQDEAVTRVWLPYDGLKTMIAMGAEVVVVTDVGVKGVTTSMLE